MEKIKELYKRYKEGIAYLFFGGCTTVVSLVSFYLFESLIGWNEHVANVLSWILSVLFAYVTNRSFVFESKAETKAEVFKEALSFYGARIATLGMEEVILYLGVSVFDQNAMLVKTAAQVLVIVANYFLSKIVVFRKG